MITPREYTFLSSFLKPEGYSNQTGKDRKGTKKDGFDELLDMHTNICQSVIYIYVYVCVCVCVCVRVY